MRSSSYSNSPVEKPNSQYLKGDTPMKSILVTGLLFCLAVPTLHAVGRDSGRVENGVPQGAASSTNDQIEVKTDRFSNATTVTLKPQPILDTPDHIITVGIKTKFGGNEPSYDFQKDLINAYVDIESQSKEIVDFGDRELHLLINGQPLSFRDINLKTDPYPTISGKLKPGFSLRKYGVVIFDKEALERLSKAKSIEMRLGPIESKLSSEVIATLREYAVQALAQRKTAKER
jgi:hypothetical protein